MYLDKTLWLLNLSLIWNLRLEFDGIILSEIIIKYIATFFYLYRESKTQSKPNKSLIMREEIVGYLRGGVNLGWLLRGERN